MKEVKTTFDEEACVRYDPFAGDFGSPGDRLLQDSIVTAAKAYPHCHMCFGPIAKGERHRVRTEINDGDLHGWRWCGLCCAAMAQSWNDDGAMVDARTTLHPEFAHMRSAADEALLQQSATPPRPESKEPSHGGN